MKKAVITADIIQSTKLTIENRNWLNEKINESLIFLNKNPLLNIGQVDFEKYRGDSFQCLVHNPKMALRTALLIKTYIKSLYLSEHTVGLFTTRKSFDVRLSLALGEVEMETGELATSDGEAFRLSGRRLDDMKKEKRTFYITTNDDYKEELDTESFLLDTLLSSTTALQCEVMYWKIYGQNETWIAESLKINQSAVNQRSTGGGWQAIHKMIKRFDEMYGKQ
jgi:hypothetical protein